MRWNGNYGIDLSMLTLLVGMAVGSTALAQITAPQPGAHKGEKGKVVQALRSAHKLLVEADHDYDGHRARAAKEVHRAVKELAGNHHPKKVQAGSAATPPVAKAPHVKQPAVHESQATSDAQMRQAQSILQGVQAELTSAHPKAAAHVTAAIAEINTALKIK